MRCIDTIVIHCTATPEGRDVSAADVKRWHTAKGWSDIGYHFLIRLDGTIETGRPIERQGAHVRGYNAHTVGVAYAGGTDANGKPADTLTQAQYAAIVRLVEELRDSYGWMDVCGHRDFPGVRKACPSFDVATKFPTL